MRRQGVVGGADSTACLRPGREGGQEERRGRAFFAGASNQISLMKWAVVVETGRGGNKRHPCLMFPEIALLGNFPLGF